MLEIVPPPNEDHYQRACDIVVVEQKCSAAFFERKLSISFDEAARIVMRLEIEGIVSAADHLGNRTIHGSKNAFGLTPKMPLKETPADAVVRNTAYSVAGEELRHIVEQLEHLDAEKRDLAEQQKEVMSEAKARGYNTNMIKKLIALRKRNKDDVAEEETILDLYKSALGME